MTGTLLASLCSRPQPRSPKKVVAVRAAQAPPPPARSPPYPKPQPRRRRPAAPRAAVGVRRRRDGEAELGAGAGAGARALARKGKTWRFPGWPGASRSSPWTRLAWSSGRPGGVDQRRLPVRAAGHAGGVGAGRPGGDGLRRGGGGRRRLGKGGGFADLEYVLAAAAGLIGPTTRPSPPCTRSR